MPFARSSSASFQRFGWRDPGGFECARSSMRITSGWRASAASRSSSPGAGTPSRAGGGRTSRSSRSVRVSGLPWVSITPATTSRPAARTRRAAVSIALVFPAPGKAPKNILSLPRGRPSLAGGAESCGKGWLIPACYGDMLRFAAPMDEALLLARAQFGLNIGFHILFPSLTIALAWYLVAFRIAYQRTREAMWLATYQLWVKIFALSFAMGVVSGVTMSFQFGTNWPRYMTTVGAIAGPLLSFEVLTAFFLEATFLGVMLFGMQRVPDWVHIIASILVAFGTTVSAFWILALNSRLPTPAGHVSPDGQW